MILIPISVTILTIASTNKLLLLLVLPKSDQPSGDYQSWLEIDGVRSPCCMQLRLQGLGFRVL